jgi:hypothetical protein
MPSPQPVRPLTVRTFNDLLLHPKLWRFLLFAGQPVRAAIAANVLLGRSLKSLAYEIWHRLIQFVGWASGRLDHPRLRRFEHSWFPVKRWHAMLGEGWVRVGARVGVSRHGCESGGEQTWVREWG